MRARGGGIVREAKGELPCFKDTRPCSRRFSWIADLERASVDRSAVRSSPPAPTPPLNHQGVEFLEAVLPALWARGLEPPPPGIGRPWGRRSVNGNRVNDSAEFIKFILPGRAMGPAGNVSAGP